MNSSLKKIVFTFTLIYFNFVFSEQSFIILKNNEIVYQEGDCDKRYSPCSTFKIAISLMAYNEYILKDERNPKLPYDSSYNAAFPIWRQSHCPSTWMKHSCVWYSQVITQKIGIEKFRSYIELFDYGNRNIVGDAGKNNGLSRCWLSSSLKISAKEQVIFIKKFIDLQYPISQEAYNFIRNIVWLESLPKDFQLYGKTGAGVLSDQSELVDKEKGIGWFVGWMQNRKNIIVFAICIEDEVDENISSAQLAQKAKKIARDKLLDLI